MSYNVADNTLFFPNMKAGKKVILANSYLPFIYLRAQEGHLTRNSKENKEELQSMSTR